MAREQPPSGRELRKSGRLARNRIRIAWMYYVEGLTQNEIAEKLDIGRVTVVRNINEALKQREVKIWIEGDIAECLDLEKRLRQTFGLDEACGRARAHRSRPYRALDRRRGRHVPLGASAFGHVDRRRLGHHLARCAADPGTEGGRESAGGLDDGRHPAGAAL